MDIQDVAIGEIKPYPQNPRKNRNSIAKVADSIKEYGFRQPIVVDEDMVVLAGHTRLEAAKRLKLDQVPIHIAEGLTTAQAKAYRLMDNRSAEDSSWDIDVLSVEVADLLNDEFDLALTGFSGDELNQLLKLDNSEEEDDIPEDVDAICEAGDLWILGNHRLKCGDSTNATDVEHLLGEVKPHLMVTDPPYGVAYDAKWRQEAGLQDSGAYGRVTNDQNADWRDTWALFPGDVAYVWCAPGPLNAVVLNSLQESGLDGRMQIVWAKSRLVIGRGHYHCQHENCWYAVRNGSKAHWSGSRKESTVWNIDKPMKSETGHSTQKPVECMRRPILNNSSPGQTVYDPFLGSGTTIIAAETEGRHCYGLELEPTYCDIIIKRWQNLTGKEAHRDERG